MIVLPVGMKNECDDYCLKITPECTPMTEGCDRDGRFIGSGLRYDTPSICGDGLPGTGENPLCESSVYRTSDLMFKLVRGHL